MLKSLLSLLLSKFYSKTESELVAHQAFPGQESQTLFYGKEVDSWATVGTGVAPFDGYLQLKAQGKAIDGIVGVSGSTVTTAVQFPWATATVTGWTKVAKGETWNVEGSGAQNISLKIFKTIGGGYKALKRFVLQGDGLCLSLSFNCLQKPSSKARNRGLVFRGCRQLRRQSYPQQWTQHGELMLLQKTAMWFFKEEHLSSSCITRLVQVLIMGVPRVSLEDLYRFGRAALCTITSKVRTAPQDSPLLLVSLSNLEKGGSLC